MPSQTLSDAVGYLTQYDALSVILFFGSFIILPICVALAWTGLFCGQRHNLIFICPALTLCAIAPGVVKHINENEFDIRGISTSFIQTGLLNLWVIQDDNDITFDDWMKKLDIQIVNDVVVRSDAEDETKKLDIQVPQDAAKISSDELMRYAYGGLRYGALKTAEPVKIIGVSCNHRYPTFHRKCRAYFKAVISVNHRMLTSHYELVHDTHSLIISLDLRQGLLYHSILAKKQRDEDEKAAKQRKQDAVKFSEFSNAKAT